MTPTAKELMNDPAFLEKRMKEQEDYIHNLFKRNMTILRRLENIKIAIHQMNFFSKQLSKVSNHASKL